MSCVALMKTSTCRALLILNVAYCALAAAQEGLPGWHMFESVERVEWSLRASNGETVDIHRWLPKNARLVESTELREVVRFVCEKERARAPFTFDVPNENLHVLLGPADCRIPHAHR